MFGYLFFFATALFYLGLALLTASKPSLVGENAMGYGLGLAFLGLGFALSSLAFSISLLAGGSLHWVSRNPGLRTTLVLLSWLFITLTTFFCAVFKWEWHSADDQTYPSFLHGLAVGHGQVWIPLLWLAAGWLSLNAGWAQRLPSPVLPGLFFAALLISTVYSGGLAVGYLRDSALQAAAEQARQQAQADEWHQRNLANIAAHQPTDPIINLLSYSTRLRPDDIRQAAVAKIKTHPAWEAEILALLKDRQAYREVYYFLDGNRVEHPGQFAGPLNESILWLAESVRADIQDSNNLQSWSFDSYGIARMLRAIDDQFLNQGVDFYPHVVRLRQALNTPPPERFRNVRFTATDVVEEWLKNHKK